MPNPGELQPLWYTEHLTPDMQTESPEIKNLDFSVYPSGNAFVELRIPICHVLPEAVVRAHSDAFDTKTLHSEVGLGPNDFMSGCYFKKRGLFEVIALERPLSDAEAFFLIAAQKATPERPIQKYLQQIRDCAALGMSQTVEIKEIPSEDQHIIDYSPDGLLEKLPSSEAVSKTIAYFKSLRVVIDTMESLKANGSSRWAVIEQFDLVPVVGARLLREMSLANDVLGKGMLSPKNGTKLDHSNVGIAMSNSRNYRFRLMLRVPKTYDENGRPVCVEDVIPAKLYPKDLANISLVFAADTLTTKQ